MSTTTPARDAALDHSGSHFISNDIQSQCADGIGREEVFLYFRAVWRGKPVSVTMHADRYAASYYDAKTDTSTNRLVPWRVYAQEAHYHDPERNGGRGDDATGTARAALGKLCEPMVFEWLNSRDYERSFQNALAHMIMRHFRDNYSAVRRVSAALDTFRDRLSPALATVIANTLRARATYEDTMAGAFDVIRAEAER